MNAPKHRLSAVDVTLELGSRPLLMIAGNRAVTSWMSVEAFRLAAGPKQFVWIDGASHNDLYDKKQYVDPAVGELAAFFNDNLREDSV